MELPLMCNPPYPLHPSVAHLLHYQYIHYYNQYIINQQQTHLQPIAVSRTQNIIPGSSESLTVGSIHNVVIRRQASPGPPVPIRIFFPPGEPPSNGWPVMLYYHGGGWVLGDIDTENPVCSNLCVRSKCVVITTDYRLAPEHPFPAAVHDSFETLLWTISEGPKNLKLDLRKAAIGGSSAGANLAAVVTQKVAQKPDLASKITFKLQLLVVPVLDNEATVDNNPTWKEFEHTASLSAKKMLWYRNHYLPEPRARQYPEASPIRCKDEDFAKLPPAIILVGELDIMRHEGQEYARKLKEAGVPVQLEVMSGMPHPFLAMDAVLDEGKRAITILCNALSEATR